MADFTLPTIEVLNALPDVRKVGGRGKGEPNPLLDFMASMPAPTTVTVKQGKNSVQQPQWSSFLVPIEEVPDTITDPKQRLSEAKDRVNKLVNKFSSLVRRIVSADETDTVDFALRKEGEGENLGLRVFRTTLEGEKLDEEAGGTECCQVVTPIRDDVIAGASPPRLSAFLACLYVDKAIMP